MQPNLPPLNAFKVFHSAAKLKSFKKAAEELNVTPTAVSHQIKLLEERLKTPLFVRKTRAVELTIEGEKLAEVTLNIFQQLTQVVSEISSAKNVVTVSTTSSFAAMWLIPKLEAFYALHPNIDVVVKTGEKVDNLEKDRRIDLAIRYGVYDETVEHSIELIQEEMGMFSAPAYASKLDSLETINLLETVWKNKRLPSMSWHSLLDESHDQIKTTIRQFDQEHHVIQAALANQGIALVSTLLVGSALKQGWLERCDFANVRNKIKGCSYYLLMPKHNIRNQSVAKFRQWIFDEMNSG
ncbi:LysR family transcriptional regulator [uncultured Vibrio sp.]|uniref:LysR family transcriptional regulator n=1 Tax=uncultured Vibrio sp. TaxID=114054 RepID=UPI0026001750|nr:LysR family transcriptional regulator [uncultured Vibrio sp.]